MEEQENFGSAIRLSTDYSFTFNILMQVTPYLNYNDLVSCAEVCTMWNSIIREDPFWSNFVLRICGYHLNPKIYNKSLFFEKIELHDIDVEGYENILMATTNLEELVLLKCNFKFNEKLANVLNNLKVFKTSQAYWQEKQENPYTLDLFKSLSNLSTLSITTCFQVPLHAIEALKQLKRLYLDADFGREFFRADLQFLENLESFGVGYTYYRQNKDAISKYNQQLSLVLENMKKLKKIVLYGIDDDFSILKTVCKIQQLQILELGLFKDWKNYSSFLSMCTNIKNLCIIFILPRYRYLDIEKVTTQNSILFSTIKELKNNLREFTWTFFDNYDMRDIEGVLVTNNNKWKSNYTSVWNNISEFKPQKCVRLQDSSEQYPFYEPFLEDFQKLLIEQLPHIKVEVSSKHFNCEFCPDQFGGKINLKFLGVFNKERLRVQWIQAHSP